MDFNINKIIKKISGYKVVSFDIFDTLIKRTVSNPTDVFELVRIKYEKKYNFKIIDFKEKRIFAEKQARKKSDKYDINYDEIYKELLNISSYGYEVIERLKNIELELELEICEKNIDIYPIYKYCVNNNKKIIIISDMYLNKNFLEQILKKNGFNVYYKLYVSSDTGCIKSKGNMFRFVLNDLKISHNSIIHIGDANRGDFIMPRVYGIKSILVPQKINHLVFYNKSFIKNEQKFKYDNLSAFININIQKYKSSNFCVGYEILGPLLYGFSKWLNSKFDTNKNERIFFLSREGNLIKKAFDIVKSKNIKTEYIYVSRRSLTVPTLSSIVTVEDLFKKITIKRDGNIIDLFKSCGLDYKHYMRYIKKFNYSENTYISDARKQDKKFKGFLDGIAKDIISNSTKEYKNLIGYLKQIGFSNKVNIVDIGWKGSMQNALISVFKEEDIDIDIKGYYVGLKSSSLEFLSKGMKAEGYLFDNGVNMENELKIMSFVGLCETLFQAQHGSTIFYEFKEDMYKPVLDKYEFSEEDKKLIIDLQNGALQFVEDYNKSVNSKLLECDENIVINSLVRLGTRPSLKEILDFGDIKFLDGRVESLVSNKKFLYYILNPRQLKSDFLNSSWKIACFKSLFKIDINYFKIYKRLKCLDK